MSNRQLTLGIDVPDMPAPERRRRRSTREDRARRQLAQLVKEEGAKWETLTRERLLVEQFDGQGVVVDFCRWRAVRRVA